MRTSFSSAQGATSFRHLPLGYTARLLTATKWQLLAAYYTFEPLSYFFLFKWGLVQGYVPLQAVIRSLEIPQKSTFMGMPSPGFELALFPL